MVHFYRVSREDRTTLIDLDAVLTIDIRYDTSPVSVLIGHVGGTTRIAVKDANAARELERKWIESREEGGLLVQVEPHANDVYKSKLVIANSSEKVTVSWVNGPPYIKIEHDRAAGVTESDEIRPVTYGDLVSWVRGE